MERTEQYQEERISLLGNASNVEVATQPEVSSRSKFVYVGAACVATALVAGVAVTSSGRSSTASFATQDMGGVDFEASNEYGVRSNVHEYPFLKAGKFAEPFRTTTLTASATVEGLNLESCSWTIEQTFESEDANVNDGYYVSGLQEQDKTFVGMGEIELEFQAPGKYLVEMTCTDENDATYTKTETVDCYYVRREMRDLTDSDRDRFLDTVKLLGEVKSYEGRSKFGEHYHDLDYFIALHLNTAGARDHDHIHDGMGVVTQHVSLTQAFECSLQAVHPSLTVPYWDYTKDSYEAKIKHGGLDGKMFEDSELWGPKWFGNTSTDKHHITDGRWAYQRITSFNSSDPSAFHSPYGYARAPWNLNPSPFVTRYHKLCGVGPELTYMQSLKDYTDYKWPTCAVHWKLTYGEHSWYDWVWESSYLPHGPVHSWIGGVGGGGSDGGCDAAFSEMTTDGLMNKTHSTVLKMNMFGTLKNLWRDYRINTPHYCALDSGDDCSIKCNFDNEGEMYDEMIITLSMYEIPYGHLTVKEIIEIANEMFCNHRYWPGDHLEAASPAETSFWPIHPTLDRLLQFKEIVQPFTTKDWSGDDDNSKTCTTEGSQCLGHNPYDLTFWKTVTKDSTTGLYKVGYRTNQEMRADLNHETYGMSYVYDSFKWDHCSTEGYDFETGTVTADDVDLR